MTIGIITVSDRAYHGLYPDKSGPLLADKMKAQYPEDRVETRIVPDLREEVCSAMRMFGSFDLILTTGGTGIGPRDITPEATYDFCDKIIPGIAENIRHVSLQYTPHAMLSRAVAGSRGQTLVINLPGSPRGAAESLEVVLPVISHALDMLKGKGHE